MSSDRNFDDIAEHFAKKIYGKRKGIIRLAVLWHDIEQYLAALPKQHRPLRVLDVGGGFGQISQRLAKLGHDVTVNDISAQMLAQARQHAAAAGRDDICLLYTSPSPRDKRQSRMPSSA